MDFPRDHPFSTYGFREELLWDIEQLHAWISREGDAPALEIDHLTTLQLEGLYEQMEASFDRWIRDRGGRRTREKASACASGSEVASAATESPYRSSVSGQFIWERSG